MSYPTLENYNEALQNHRNCLTDPELKAGTMAKSGLGLPLALCGGFALTYTITTGGRKYAVRCFHKKSNNLEMRYKVISKRLKGMRSNYFIDFEFQETGVRIKGNNFPVVKMAWASGKTLGEFLGKQYTNKNDLQNLIQSFQTLSNFLENEGIAHGDIQPGNVMVDNRGQSLQLIDYDGIFVDELKSLGSSELGLINFQHPGRTGDVWDKKLDRFSLIVLNLSLRALQSDPNLWTITQSDENGVLFKANDFKDPSHSRIFQQLLTNPQLSDEVKNFASICKSPYDKTPSLEDFLAKKNIPQTIIKISKSDIHTTASYLSAYPVLDGTDYSGCFNYVGDRVEVIGQITDFVQRTTKYGGKPYVFLNFGDWHNNIVKINIWSEGLEALPNKPSQSWVGKWISVVGLMEPPYHNPGKGYTHLSITITRASEINIIQENEARYRLAEPRAIALEPISQKQNREILREIRGPNTVTNNTTPTYRSSNPPQKSASAQPVQAPKKVASPNQAILQNMKSKQPASGTTVSKPVMQQAKKVTVKQKPQSQKASQPLWKFLLAVGAAVFFYLICFMGIGGVGFFAQTSPTERPSATAVVHKTATKTPSIVIEPTATQRPNCISWLAIKGSMEGQTKCIYGVIAYRNNFYDGNAFLYSLIRFSDDTKDFYITSHTQQILNFKAGDCIMAKSKVSIDKNGMLFMEVSEVTPSDKCPK